MQVFKLKYPRQQHLFFQADTAQLERIKKKSPDEPGTMEVMVILLSGFVLCKR